MRRRRSIRWDTGVCRRRWGCLVRLMPAERPYALVVLSVLLAITTGCRHDTRLGSRADDTFGGFCMAMPSPDGQQVWITDPYGHGGMLDLADREVRWVPGYWRPGATWLSDESAVVVVEGEWWDQRRLVMVDAVSLRAKPVTARGAYGNPRASPSDPSMVVYEESAELTVTDNRFVRVMWSGGDERLLVGDLTHVLQPFTENHGFAFGAGYKVDGDKPYIVLHRGSRREVLRGWSLRELSASPKGDMIAAIASIGVARVPSEFPRRQCLMVVNTVAPDQPVMKVEGQFMQVHWSPDERAIACISALTPSELSATSLTIVSVPDGSTERIAAGAAITSPPVWTSGGKAIVFSTA